MNYSWINTPLLDGLEYFIGTFGYFVNEARKLGSVLGLLGIIWYSFQLLAGTTTPRKVIVSLITKFLLFIIVLNIYFPVVMGVRSLVTRWGSNAGISAETLTKELTNYMKNLEIIVASENASAEAELAAAVAELSSININPRNPSQRLTEEGQRWRLANERKEYAEKIIQARQNDNPSWNMRTLEAIKTILIPVNLEGEEGNAITEAYFLDLQLRDVRGNTTGFLSPNAVLRIALLTAQIMFQKEMMAISAGMEERQNEKSWIDIRRYETIMNLSLVDIFNFLLTCLCCLGIILAAIFALLQYIMCIFEYTVITSIGIIFVPTLLFDGTKDMANKIMPAILGLSIKLLVMTLCMFFAFHLFIGLAFNQIGENTTINFTVFAYVAFTILLAFVVTQNAPQIAVTLLTGNPQLSMGELVQAAATVAAAGHIAGKAGGLAVSAAGKAFGGAANTAGFMQEAGQAAKTVYSSAKDNGYSGGAAAAMAAGAAGSVAMGRAGTAFKSALHGLGHMGMGRAGGGGSGYGGFANRFAGNAESTLSNTRNRDKDGNKNSDYNNTSGKDGNKNFDYNDTSYRYGRDSYGNPITMNEYMTRMKTRGTEAGNKFYDKFAGAPKEFPNLQKYSNSNVSYVGSFPLPEPRGYLPAPEERKSLPPSDIIYL